MSVSGHKPYTSIRRYSRCVSELMKQEMFCVLRSCINPTPQEQPASTIASVQDVINFGDGVFQFLYALFSFSILYFVCLCCISFVYAVFRLSILYFVSLCCISVMKRYVLFGFVDGVSD